MTDSCRKLWPFVRHFALAGGHPDAIDAILEIGEEIGEIVPGGKFSSDQTDLIIRETLEGVSRYLSESSSIRAKIGSRLAEAISQDVLSLTSDN